MQCVACLQCVFFRLSIFLRPILPGFLCRYSFQFQPCFICHPQIPRTVGRWRDAGIEPRTAFTSSLAVRRSYTVRLYLGCQYMKLKKPNSLTMSPFRHSRTNNKNIYFVIDHSRITAFHETISMH
jgi:hypothetical protein